MLGIIENILVQAHARHEEFRHELGLEGYTKKQLAAFLADAQRFDAEFTKREADAERLAEAGRPAARLRLAAIQHELQQSITQVQDAYHLRSAHEARLSQQLAGLRDQTGPPTGGIDDIQFHENEPRSLGRIEEIYQEFCRAGQAFGVLCSQHSFGPPAAILEAHWRQLEELDTRFAELEGEATHLAAIELPAARQRLSLVRGDLCGTIAIVKKMHAARIAAGSRTSELDSDATQDLAESILEMSRILGKSRGDRE